MTVIIHPTGAELGFEMAELSLLPEVPAVRHGRMQELNLFPATPVSSTSVLVTLADGVLKVLPNVARGGPSTLATRDRESGITLRLPHFPHDDVVVPEDLQGIPRDFANPNVVEALANVMSRRLARIYAQHAQTLEWMRWGALRGLVLDGAGLVMADLHEVFGTAQETVSLRLDEFTSEVGDPIRSIVRAIHFAARGLPLRGVRALVGPDLWSRLIRHESVRGPFQWTDQTPARGLDPNGHRAVREFRLHGIVFELHEDTSFVLADGREVEPISPTEAVAFPIVAGGLGRTYCGPANWIDRANTEGRDFDARQIMRPDGTGIDVLTQSNVLPVNLRPGAVLRVIA